MRDNSKVVEDLGRVASGAFTALSTVRGQMKARMQDRANRFAIAADLVGRAEFEAVEAMAAKARAEQERLEKRIAELETRIASLSAAQDPAPDDAKPKSSTAAKAKKTSTARKPTGSARGRATSSRSRKTTGKSDN